MFKVVVKTVAVVLIGSVLFLAQPARAVEPFKVGILDLQKCLDQSEAGKKAKKVLQDKSERIKKDLTLKRDELKKNREEFTKKASVMNADARRDKEKELLRKEEDFRDIVREKEEEMRKDEYSAMQPLLNDLFEVTTKVAKDEGFTLILEAKSGVVYFNKTIEITDKVIKLFNEAKPKEKEKRKRNKNDGPAADRPPAGWKTGCERLSRVPGAKKNPGVPLQRLAEIVGGEVRGPCEEPITGINSLREAGPGEITFLANPRYASALNKTGASAVIVDKPLETSKPLLITRNPYLAYARIAAYFAPRPDHPAGVSPQARVGEEFRMGEGVSVYPLAYIGDQVTLDDRVCIFPGVYLGNRVRIGSDTVIFPNVSILDGTLIGARVIIHSGTVIGSDGYGFARDGERQVKIPQLGIVQIDDDCEIGANNTIDRAALGKTWVQQGVKTDNQVHIAHNVVIGEHSLLIAQVGISGSATLGRGVILAGQTGVAGHITIGDRVMVGGKSGVAKSIPAGEIVSGNPTMPHQTYLRSRMVLPPSAGDAATFAVPGGTNPSFRSAIGDKEERRPWSSVLKKS